MRTSKEINRYTDHVTDINNEKMQDKIQKVLIRETMDIQEVN